MNVSYSESKLDNNYALEDHGKIIYRGEGILFCLCFKER